MEIPSPARKCPHCHHFQNRLASIEYHPASAVLLVCIPVFAFLIVLARMFEEGEEFQDYQRQIQVVESQLAFGEKSGETVVVLGTMTNMSPVPWKEIQFHVDFFDGQGRRVDVGQKEEHSFYLPAQAATSFKLSFRREFPQTYYVEHHVRVLTAKDARARW